MTQDALRQPNAMGPVTDQDILQTLRGAPAWITLAMVCDTLNTWQPYYDECLTADEAFDMLLRVGHPYRLLLDDPKPKLAVPARTPTPPNHRSRKIAK